MIKELLIYDATYLALNILLIIVALRIFKNQNNQICAFWSAIISFIFFIPLAYIFSRDILLIILVSVLLEAYIHFHILNIVHTSRRMKLIETIAKNKIINIELLDHLFNENDMISIRLERLEKAGQINEKNKRYFVKNFFMLYIAKLLYLSSKVFSVEWGVIRSAKRDC